MKNVLRVLHVDKSLRGQLFAETLLKSQCSVENHIACDVVNPGILRISKTHRVGPVDNPDFVVAYARSVGADFAIIGPEEPLANGVVDRLLAEGIPCIGPTEELAQLESSKSFTRNLLREFDIPGNPEHRVFDTEDGLAAYLESLGEYVVKPDGLSGGKGVRVSGDHLATWREGLAYCRELLSAGGRVVIEERLIGEEFTFQSFCDGLTCRDMIPVQDHKRLLDDDRGPNTGGMGSYSCEDHLLPFLSADNIAQASRINQMVADALREKTGHLYKGILYGSFILTSEGLRVIEYNARFGDPEVMNVLSLLETDFVDICQAIIGGTLHELNVTFAKRASVCKYVVPNGYPTDPARGAVIEVPPVDNSSDALRMYYGAVENSENGHLRMTGSRALAFVGLGDTLDVAELNAEAGAQSVVGPVIHRADIGTRRLVQRRVDHMNELRSRQARARRFA